MSYPWPTSQQISLTNAVAMTETFRANRSTVFNSSYANALCNSETFKLAEVNALLAVTGAAGLRIYYGMDDNYNIHAILAAVDEQGNDIIPPENASLNGDPAILLEQGIRCPPTCPEESPLNS
jgi:hypothetical protein